jgi:hypothetical protein
MAHTFLEYVGRDYKNSKKRKGNKDDRDKEHDNSINSPKLHERKNKKLNSFVSATNKKIK